MQFFVVVDTMGAGRVVGTFSTELQALRVIGEFAHYYHLIPAQTIDPIVPPPGTPLYIVLEEEGPLTVHCVFRTKGAAERIAAASPYRRIELCNLDRINPVALEWAVNARQREWLEHLMGLQTPRD